MEALALPVIRDERFRTDAYRDAVLGTLCVLAFMTLNPFVALFFVASIAVFRPVPAFPFLVSATLAFTLFFYFREYGVYWYPDSTDDIPQYIAMYHSNAGLSVLDVLKRFVTLPPGNEPLWHLLWWAPLNVFKASDETFIFLHYLLVFGLLLLSLYTLSARYFILFVLVHFLLTPTAFATAAHIWRQQVSFSVFLAGIGLYVAQGRKGGRWLIYLSPLLHLSSCIFVAIFVLFEATRARARTRSKARFLLDVGVVFIAVKATALLLIVFLNTIGLGRVAFYFFEGTGSVARVYLLTVAYVVPLLAIHAVLRNDDLNEALLVLALSVFSIMFAFPAANSIYDRLFMFALPLAGLYVFRAFMLNFPMRWALPVLGAVFVTGAARVYAPTLHNSGFARFLAHGHAFDPFMGIASMLIRFGGF